MNLFSFFKKEQKSYCDGSQLSYLTNCFTSDGYHDLTAAAFVGFYKKVMPVADAIDKISTAFSALEPKVWDKSKKEFVPHPVLQLLQIPNADVTQQEFLRSMSAFYLITGNNYLLATGNVTRPALELFVVPPQEVSHQVATDGFVKTYRQNSHSSLKEYDRQEIDKRYKFYNSSLDQEIYHTKDFNPNSSDFRVVGMSRLQAIVYELEQYLNASVHNDSLLKNGARPSGALLFDGVLTPDQQQVLRTEIDNIFSGANNAGRPTLLQGGFQWTEMSISPKDMDFAEMKTMVTNAIYNRLNIPLPSVSTATMTLANLESSRLDIYYKAILPVADTLFAELSDFLLSRYPNSENLEITYDKNDIEALQPVRDAQIQLQSGLNILSVNELRDMIGKNDVSTGEDIYKPSNMIPIGSDEDPTEVQDESIARQKFFDLMRRQKKADGKELYTEKQIEKLAVKNGFSSPQKKG